MKKQLTLILLFLLIIEINKAQVYNPINYNYNGTPSYGIKIKTNLPFINGSQMPTIIFEGFEYGGSAPFGVTLVYYIYGGVFYYPKASSWGGYTPNIKLANENGKVVIFLDEKKYFNRFSIRAFGQGMSEEASWFQGWTASDEPINGSNITDVPYQNNFAGNVFLPGNGIWSSSGNVGIGTNGGFNSISGTESALSIYNSNAASIYLQGGGNKHILFAAGNGLNYYNATQQTYPLIILNNGNVGIGTTTPQNKLDVAGTIRCTEVKVVALPWADFVFKPTYKLRTLGEVDQFIKTNNHLPEIPSENEVKENGIGLGEMNTKLLQKIEELTLYMIEQQKQMNELKKENQELRKDIKTHKH